MDWVRNALSALAEELVKAEARAIEQARRYEQAQLDSTAANAVVSDLESARDALRALLDASEREVPY